MALAQHPEPTIGDVNDRRSPVLGSLICVIAACLFALLGVISRTTYDLGLTPYAFVTWRSGVAAMGMAVVVLWRLRRGGRLVGWRSLAPQDRVALGVAALAGASLDVTMFLAFARVPVAIVLLCFYLFPAIVAAGSALLGWERMDRTRAAALVFALGGMVAVVIGGEGTSALGGLDPIGVLLAIGSAVSQAVFVLVSRRGFREVPTEQAMTVVLAVSAGIATLLAIGGGALATVWLPLSAPNLLGVFNDKRRRSKPTEPAARATATSTSPGRASPATGRTTSTSHGPRITARPGPRRRA